ncbi:MAG: type I secretion system permease/ATPase [Gammaproteobacteria bacterium]
MHAQPDRQSAHASDARIQGDRPARDPGLDGLCVLAAFHGVPAQPGPLKHALGGTGTALGSADLLRAARMLGLRARASRCRPSQLSAMPLPALARMRDGGFAILACARADCFLVQMPGEDAPRAVSRASFLAEWGGDLILIARAGVSAARGPFGFGWFLPALLRYRRDLAEVLAGSLALQCLALVSPLAFQVVIDKVLAHRALATLDVLCAALLAVVVFETVLGALRGYVLAHTAGRIDARLGADLHRHLMRLPLAWFQARRLGDIAARARELEAIRAFLTGTTLTVSIDAAFTAVYLAMLVWYSPPLALVVLATLPAYAGLALAITPRMRSRLADRFDSNARSQAFLVESIGAIETVKGAAVEPQQQRRWEELLAAQISAGLRATHLSNLAGALAGLVQKLGMLALLWLGARQVIDGALSVGELVAFNMIAGRVCGPILRLAQLWQDFQQAGLSVRRLGDLLDAPAETACQPGRGSLPRLAGRITFDDVWFRYGPQAPEVLRGLSLEIPAGQVIGVVGRSGSGKSTLARLVQRLFVPERGRVLVDGVDLAQVDPAWLRARIGAVSPDSRLFARTIRENIALADPALPLDRVVRAATLAGAHEFVLTLPQGYDTPIGEHGVSLSAGQRQRLAVARALAAEPAILILDEATSALDHESERALQNNMRSICRGRTVIVVAHRPSALRFVDRVIVIEGGVLVEDGVPADLMRRGGWFARMVRGADAAA